MIGAEAISPREAPSNELDVTDILDKPIASVIQDYVQMAAGNTPEAVRKPGLFLVHEDLQKIKRFARRAIELPVKDDEVVAYLGYSTSFIKGLEPDAIVDLHKRFHDLVFIWNGIQRQMIKVGSTLITFHTELVSFGGNIVNLIRSMEGYEAASALVGDVVGQKVSTLPSTPLQGKDLGKLPSLLGLTQELVSIVSDYEQRAATVRGLIGDFGGQLRSARTEISRKLTLVVENEGSDIALKLSQELALLNERIEEVGRTYATYTNYIWVGAWWGPVGLIISGTIFGITASEVKVQHDSLIEQKTGLEKKLNSVNKVMPMFLKLEADLQTLQLLTEEAVSGVANLENVWTMIGAWINASVKSIRKTENATELFLFEARLSNMINQWNQVAQQAVILMQALNQDAKDSNLTE
jgi:hypothetical protein